MKKVIFLGIVLIFAISCQQTKHTDTTSEEYQTEVKQKITQLMKLHFEAWENEDLESSMSLLDEGYINMFYFGPSVAKGKCREPFQNVFDTYSIEGVEFKSTDLIADQNYAIETGLFKQKWITNDKQDTVLFNMRSMTVYKKQEDGSWKIFRMIGQHEQ